MGEIVAGIDGIGEACRALDFPVDLAAIARSTTRPMAKASCRRPPSAAWACCKMCDRMATIAFKREGDAIILIGETKGHLGQSIYLREIEGREEGAAPPVDLAAEKRNGDFVRGLIEAGRVDTVHDVSDGGLLVALAEMAMAGDIGADVDVAATGRRNSPSCSARTRRAIVLAVPRQGRRRNHCEGAKRPASPATLHRQDRRR